MPGSRETNSNVGRDIGAIICAVLIPPLGVYLHLGTCGAEVAIAFVLTLLTYWPGILFALYIVLTKPGQNAIENRPRAIGNRQQGIANGQ